MTTRKPITFTRNANDNRGQNAWNRVQLETGDDVVVSDTNPLPVSSTASTAWTIRYIDDEVLNDSDKTIAVTALSVWHILAIRVELATDANAGNRQLAIEFQDGAGDVQWDVRPDLVQAASLTYLYNFGSSMSDLDALRDADWLSTPIPPTLILPENSQIRIYDNNAISAAGDDMIVHITVAERLA